MGMGSLGGNLWLLVAVAGLGTMLVTMLLRSEDNWSGVIYPDRGDLIDYTRIGEFESLEACRNAALSRLELLQKLDEGDYECGLNCEPGLSGLQICEETRR